MVIKNCIICGKEIEVTGNGHLCSPQCKKIRKSQVDKKYRDNNKETLARKKKEYAEKNSEKLRKYWREYHQNNIEKVRKYRENNKEKIRESKHKYYIKHRDLYDKICVICGKEFITTKKYVTCSKSCSILNQRKPRYENIYRYGSKLLKLNKKLTRSNRSYWGKGIRYIETINSKHNYMIDFETHHVLPLALYPHFGLDGWNGVPLPQKWHKEFHRKYNIRDYSLDWPGLLFGFIHEKIQESNSDLTTLNKWILISKEGIKENQQI